MSSRCAERARDLTKSTELPLTHPGLTILFTLPRLQAVWDPSPANAGFGMPATANVMSVALYGRPNAYSELPAAIATYSLPSMANAIGPAYTAAPV